MIDAPSMDDEPCEVMIVTTAFNAKVVVGGTDMSRYVAGYQIQQQAGQPAQVILFPRALTTAFDGLATVAVAQEAPPGEMIAAFLAGVDPAVLDAAVLDRADLDGGPHELTTAMLKQLAAWALGKTT